MFRNVRVDSRGYGIVWNDDLDLSESELWLNGVDEPAETDATEYPERTGPLLTVREGTEQNPNANR